MELMLSLVFVFSLIFLIANIISIQRYKEICHIRYICRRTSLWSKLKGLTGMGYEYEGFLVTRKNIYTGRVKNVRFITNKKNYLILNQALIDGRPVMVTYIKSFILEQQVFKVET